MMSLELRKALQRALIDYGTSGSSAGYHLREAVEKILMDDLREPPIPARLSSARITVDAQLLIDARIDFAALYHCTSAYRGDRLPLKDTKDVFERANKMIGRLDAVIADLPKG